VKRGGEEVSRHPHTVEITGSSPVPASNNKPCRGQPVFDWKQLFKWMLNQPGLCPTKLVVNSETREDFLNTFKPTNPAKSNGRGGVRLELLLDEGIPPQTFVNPNNKNQNNSFTY
jgi:hypothetical protein